MDFVNNYGKGVNIIMANMEIHYSSKESTVETPQKFFDMLDREFCFQLDVCATAENAKCKRY